MREYFYLGGITLACVGILGMFVWAVWWDYQHPCVQYQAVFVPAHDEYDTDYIEIGDITIPITTVEHIPDQYVQQCVARGDRRKGDVEAGPAPIPTWNGPVEGR